MIKTTTILFFIISAIFFEYGCTSKNYKDPKITSDTLSFQTKDLSIPRSINVQKKLSFDSILIDSFLIKYQNFSFVKAELKSFYRARNFAYAWFDYDGMIEQAEQLYNKVIHLEKDGLADTTLYQTTLTSIFENSTDRKINSEVDILLTAQYFYYSQLIYNGLPESISKSLEWFLPRKKIAPAKLLDSLLKSPSADVFMNEPNYYQYQLLKKQLSVYREIKPQKENEIIVPTKKKYLFGDSSTVILTIRNKLEILGDLLLNNQSLVFDKTLQIAVGEFQKRHGLIESGTIDTDFLKELNVPISKRIRQIIINMERCRWLPNKLEKEHLIVNIPEFSLHNYSDDSLLWSMKAIVGSESRKTIIFKSKITQLVFSPYWNIPEGILKKDILPAIEQDKNFLEKNNMEIVGYNGITPKIRQKPGENNALGGVKFVLPNLYSIYLHDTPSKYLFKRENRALSSGCIRLEDAEKLTCFLLRNQQEWTEAKIRKAMDSGKELYINLKETIPVYIVYFTCWVDNSGKINFRKDVYGSDKKLEEIIIK